jgi:multiple sugar transport system permease protein
VAVAVTLRDEKRQSERRRAGRERRLGALVGVAVVAWLLFALTPYLWMLLTSLKPSKDLYQFPLKYLPSQLTLEGYAQLVSGTPFFQYFRNSAMVAGFTVLVVAVVATCAAYALSRYDIPGKPLVLTGLLVTQLIPNVLLVLPIFLSLREMGLLDNPLGLVIVHSAFALPFTTWMLTGFLDGLPRELEEAARIDGCNDIGAFRWVILPLLGPGLAASATYVFIYSWNEFIYALTFTSSEAARTLPVGLHSFVGEYLIRWDLLTAGGVLSALPTVIFFLLVQRHLISGLTSGAVKA